MSNAKTTKRVRSTVAGKVVRASAGATRQLGPEAIAQRAYELYEAGGRIDGQHERHWLQAESELLGQAS